ncbi:hypothetical protein M378DRAFT_160544 [Amanita muscaria Koide BX008]|uniref:Uncharacterized protein n=1 Tax=Amanita muscaria (strain Koide BX008) TaxID=946122 RepID=A0A0C2XB54_AMAMK|nr:hypothetical protein M378DRAFT_160544 [Amanita muscaria Koide BX008]
MDGLVEMVVGSWRRSDIPSSLARFFERLLTLHLKSTTIVSSDNFSFRRFITIVPRFSLL